MSFWIRALCERSSEAITPDDLKAGIASRLALLTSLFCPEDEESPTTVLQRLRVGFLEGSKGFQSLAIYYRSESDSFIRVDRCDRSGVAELEHDLSPQTGPKIEAIRKTLLRVTEDVTFCLKDRDVRGMGFPVSIAAAACLVSNAGGIILSGRYSWMVPSKHEVRIILETKA